MMETENLNADLFPYLKLKESEKILVINRSRERSILPVAELVKYHDPDKFPEKFFQLKEKNYEYYVVDIVTNYRTIFFCLNFPYLKDDGVTPVLDIFHIDNYLVWINNEDIKDCDIRFGQDIGKGISVVFDFYHDDNEKVKLFPIRVFCSDYTNYLKVKEVLIHTLGLNSAKIKYQEQQRINSIRFFNIQFNIFGTVLLVFFGIFAYFTLVDEESTFSVSYIDVGLYILYVIFFVLNNIHWNRELKQDIEVFLQFAENDLTWYRGPFISFVVFAFCIVAIFLDMAYSTIITNNIFSLLASIGSIASFSGLIMLIVLPIEKMKKQSSE